MYNNTYTAVCKEHFRTRVLMNDGHTIELRSFSRPSDSDYCHAGGCERDPVYDVFYVTMEDPDA